MTASRTPASRRTRRGSGLASALAAAVCLAAAVPSAALASPAAPPAVVANGATVLTGTLASGATWEARVPVNWNGTLVLYGHGFRGPGANPAWDDKMDPTFAELAKRGYAVAASSYSKTGWALGTAVQDQLQTLQAFERGYAAADRVIAYGRSMGGLVTSLIAEVPESGVDGAVSTCGLVGGGAALNNYQLDAAYAAAQLLLPGTDLKLTGFTSPAESAPTVEALKSALEQAQQSPQGRARISLVAALLNTPTALDGVDQKDPVAMQQAQYQLVLETLPTVISRRSDIVLNAGGDSGWTAGVDYQKLVMVSPQASRVRELYRGAGLDLAADLRALTRGADIAPDEDALAWMLQTSVPTGELQVPVLATHTLVDLLAPVEYQEDYAATVRRAGAGSLLRTAFVDRDGHCNFSVAENVASIEALDYRLDSGHWDTAARTSSLDAAAEAMNLDGAAFVDYKPGEFINDRSWRR